jgi:hypothetical protein
VVKETNECYEIMLKKVIEHDEECAKDYKIPIEDKRLLEKYSGIECDDVLDG